MCFPRGSKDAMLSVVTSRSYHPFVASTKAMNQAILDNQSVVIRCVESSHIRETSDCPMGLPSQSCEEMANCAQH